MTAGRHIKLVALGDGIQYWRRGSNGGIVDMGDAGILIDTGADQVAAEALLSVVKDRQWNKTYIINTHNHHDHTAGNELLQHEGAEIFVARSPGRQEEFPQRFIFVLPMPGHSSDSIGIQTDNVFWAGDAVFAPEILRRFAVPAYLDVAAALSSLDRLERHLHNYSVDWGVAGHGQPLRAQEFASAIQLNRHQVLAALSHLHNLVGAAGLPTDDGALPLLLTREWLERAGGTWPAIESRQKFWSRVGAAYLRAINAIK